MGRMIFVNLPVKDLPHAKRFYEAVGFTNEPRFTDDTAAAMQWSDTIVVARSWAYTFWSRPALIDDPSIANSRFTPVD